MWSHTGRRQRASSFNISQLCRPQEAHDDFSNKGGNARSTIRMLPLIKLTLESRLAHARCPTRCILRVRSTSAPQCLSQPELATQAFDRAHVHRIAPPEAFTRTHVYQMARFLLHVNMPLTLSNVTPLQEDKHFRKTYSPCSESSFRLDAVSTLVSTLVARPKKPMLSKSWSIQLNHTRACTLMPAKSDPRNE